jgi:hypothetical protein
MRPQHRDVGDFEPLQQQRQQVQIRGQDVDVERGLGHAVALEPDLLKGDVASGENRNLNGAFDHEVEAGHGADLRLDRLAQGLPVEQPGHRDQTDQR